MLAILALSHQFVESLSEITKHFIRDVLHVFVSVEINKHFRVVFQIHRSLSRHGSECCTISHVCDKPISHSTDEILIPLLLLGVP